MTELRSFFDPRSMSPAERSVAYLFLALVLIKAAAYWIGSAILLPDDPFTTIVLYRGKDIESFPIMRNLGYLGFGEPGLYEGNNSGVLSERFIPWTLHAVLFRALGPAGFVVGDLLITPAHFLLLAALLWLCGISRITAFAVAAVLTCAAIDDFGEQLPGLGVIPRFWGLRLPRPFVSELFLLIALIGAVAALNGLRERGRGPTWAWAGAGGGLALLLQSDFYSAIALGLGFLGVLAARLVARRTEWRALAAGAGVAALAALLFSAPGLIQSLFVNPESMVRLGLYETSRWRPPFIDMPGWYAGVAGLIALGWIVDRRARTADVPQIGQRSGRAIMIAACLGALAAMPFTTLATGKAVELYHYRDTFVRLFSLALLVYGLHIAHVVWQYARARRGSAAAGSGRVRSIGRTAGVTAAAIVCLLFAWRHATAGPAQSGHMRADFPEWAALGDYRRPFVELVRELSSERYDQLPVLGTFDHQVWSWWLTFRGGYSYLGDACTTNAENPELERRAAELARTLGMSREEFLTFARRRYVMIFWMSCSKYQATRGYSFAPSHDYSEQDQRLIRSTPAHLGFTVALPLSQQERLQRLYDSLGPTPRSRLDVVVLTRDVSLGGFSPPENEFESSFENELFRVWTRRNGPAN